MFRTELTIAPATGQLPRTARVLTVGSCFADSIGSRLATNKVETLVNPFGTVFQPLALARLLRAAAGEEVDWQQHLVEARGRWQSYDLHGRIGADSPVALLQNIQELVQRTGEFLRSADVVLLTLGTAWAYRLRETGELVSNCHKQSADLFVRELLTPDEIINALAETHAYLRRINPELRFVVTVSPVRHLKDTLQLNAVSKSVLRLATHIVSDLLPGVAYFPAYELLMDDLRDYRFYEADMLHPSAVAEDYVWEKFARTYFDADFGRFRKEWAAVQQSLEHRPLHAGAPEHRQFLESTREKLEQLRLRKVEVGTELAQVRTQLAALPVPQLPKPVAMAEDDEERIDIGDDTAADMAAMPVQPVITPVAPIITEGRSPRLSPEEFRAQRAARPERGRRDGRGKGQQVLPTENEQFQTAVIAADNQAETLRMDAPPLEAEATDQILNPAALDSEAVADSEEPAKKKKRRSRGGAKRTARKNALRLAAGELSLDSDPNAMSITADGEDQLTTKAADKPAVSLNTKSVPVKRGGRRDEPSRVPRVPLFAAGVTPEDAEAAAMANAELPALSGEQNFAAALPEPDNAVTAELGAVPKKSRNSRNRNRKGGGRNEFGNPLTAETGLVPETNISTVALPIGGATRLVGTVDSLANTPNSFDNRALQAFTAPAPSVSPVPAMEAGAAPVAASRQPRRKARAISAARPEKPAIDTPVIPVPDDTMVRMQVAAGRMMGSSASLITPSATPKKVVATKKVTTSAKAAVVTPEVVEAAQVVPVLVEALPQAPVAKPKSAPKSKHKTDPARLATLKPVMAKAEIRTKAVPATKLVATAAKLTVAKTATAKKTSVKPTDPVEATASKAAPVAKATKRKKPGAPVVSAKTSPPKIGAPKRAAAKPAAKTDAKPAAQKPKPPKKPAKPA